jgi:hypothetical protein
MFIFASHSGQGFARYSTDEKWHVPHFEKMLYDQAQLAAVFTDAYLLTKDQDFARVVGDIVSYVSSDLSDPSGGFYRYLRDVATCHLCFPNDSKFTCTAQKTPILIRKPDQWTNVKEPSVFGLTKKFTHFWLLNRLLVKSDRVSQCPTLFAITLTSDPTATWIPIRSVYLIHGAMI